MNIAMVLAGGSGTRFGSALPKQYHRLNGMMVIEYVAQALKGAKTVDKIVFVGHAEEPHLAEVLARYHADCAAGGSTRNLSIQSGLDYIRKNFPCDNVMILDAVRPMVTSELIDLYFDKLNSHDAVTTTQEITDSLGCRDCWEVDRSRYYLMQSPEAYRFDLLYRHFDKESKYTEVLHHLPNTTNAYLHFGFTNNIKLTYGWELEYVSALFKKNEAQ